MATRPHATRLLADLNDTRTELISTVREFSTEDFLRQPREGTKNLKQQLQEIGAMEVLTFSVVTQKAMPDWMETWATLEHNDVETLLADLTRIRATTIEFLEKTTEEALQTPVLLPVEWQQYFDRATHREPEELIRWINRHEYYHLGQIVILNMLFAK